jgi:hypothetical protein
MGWTSITDAGLLCAFHLGNTAFMYDDLDGAESKTADLSAHDFKPRFGGDF